MKKRQKIEVVLMLAVGLCGFGWMFFELAKRILIVSNQSSISSIPFDGKIQHGIGELMVSISFFSILLMSKVWLKERVFLLSSKLRFVMIIGGLLNGLAWFTTSSEEPWNGLFRMWCLFLFIFSIFATRIANWMVSKTKDV